MLELIAASFGDLFGPLRLFTSTLFMAGLGSGLAMMATWYLLPRYWHVLPTDQGRAHAVAAEQSVGKPVAGGLIFVPLFVFVCLLVLPLTWPVLTILACVMLHMAIGYLDDSYVSTAGKVGLSEATLGIADFVIALIASAAVCQLAPTDVWLPLMKGTIEVPPWLFIGAGSMIIWVVINATNCTDGVDGLSGSLAALALVSLGAILYGIVGHQDIAAYLLVPHYSDGATWALMAFAMVGVLAGYLWHNSYPSAVLMGDAGSRPIGLLLGVLVLACGNPFLILVVAFVMLANGATGLVKVALLRFFRIAIFRNVRYPLHDHMRKNLNWSATQVLVRFMLLQAVGTPLLLVLLLKVR